MMTMSGEVVGMMVGRRWIVLGGSSLVFVMVFRARREKGKRRKWWETHSCPSGKPCVGSNPTECDSFAICFLFRFPMKKFKKQISRTTTTGQQGRNSNSRLIVYSAKLTALRDSLLLFNSASTRSFKSNLFSV